MSKSPFDIFKAIGEAAKFVDDVSRAAAKHRDSNGKVRRPMNVDDLAAGLFDTVRKNVSSTGNATERPFNPSKSEARKKPRITPGFNETRWELVDAHKAAKRDFERAKDKLIREIEGHLSRLKHERTLLLREPHSMPLVQPDNAAAFFSDISAEALRLAQELEQIYADLQPIYRAIAERMAAEHSPSQIADWQDRAESERLKDLAMSRAHFERVGRLTAKLQTELERFRTELHSADFGAAKADFDSAQPLLRQFRKGMPLGTTDLVQIKSMIDAEWSAQHAAFAKLPFKDVLQTASTWQQEGMPVEAVNFVIALYGQMTLFRALREMGLDKSVALQTEPLAERPQGIDRPSGAELLKRIPGALPLTCDDQRDRLIDALVLASECALPPIETHNLAKALAQLTPVPAAPDDDARLHHYRSLAERLEESALGTIGRRTGEERRHSFKPLHLVILRQLREAAGIDTPSAALAAWDRHLASRQAVREQLIGTASTFWRPLLTALIDRKGVSEGEQFKADRDSLAPVAQMDNAARAVILNEARAIFKAFDSTAFGMASKADDWLSIEAPFGNAQRKLLGSLVAVLSMGETERAAYFAPPPEAPPLGEFSDLVAQLSADRNHFNNGPFGQALRALDFAAADKEIRRWIAVTPPSALRQAMLQFDPASLRIADWDAFNAFAKRPECAAIGLDWSGHVLCEIADAKHSVPFEIGFYSRKAFPEGEFGTQFLRAHARQPFPWQGGFDDVTVGFAIEGIAPLVLELYAFRDQERADWGKELRAYHGAMNGLCEALMFLMVNQIIARELAANASALVRPVIVGTHDFGYFDPVVHGPG